MRDGEGFAASIYDFVTDVSDHRFAANVSVSSTALAPFHRVKPFSASCNRASSSVSLTLTMWGTALAVVSRCPIAKRAPAREGRAAERAAPPSRWTATAAARLANTPPTPNTGYQTRLVGSSPR